MNIVWVSPEGDGKEIVDRVITAGHSVVAYGMHGLAAPYVVQGALAPFCRSADLVVVDGPFPLTPTRRSWKPANESLFVDELRRHYNVRAIGPTPTIDLLIGDRRYLRKMCGRFDVPYRQSAEGEPWSSGGWFLGNSVVPEGPYLRAWVPLFKSVGFRGWFELTGTVTPDGPIVTGARADWDTSIIPDGREAEWFAEMAQK